MARAAEKKDRPNIVLILADDLGPGELGCYGQQIIQTPNIDRIAKEGMRFTQAYSSSPVCAPARCSLLTGLHTGHCFIRDNKEIKPEGQLPIPADTVTIAKVLKAEGYATACVGKWGLGPSGSSGDPNAQGFDFFYGHICQRVAHNHYTDHIWKNGQRVELDGKQYTPDLMADEAINWLKAQKNQPFFLYFATPLPHVSLQVPEDGLAKYRGKLGEEIPFPGKGDYPPCAEPKATYAAMISRIDDYVGRIMNELKELGVDEKTLVIFASDNGPTFASVGGQAEFFNSALGLRGLKEDVYEGGIRVPMIARWLGKIQAGSEEDRPTVLYDFFATVCEAAQTKDAPKTDGVSMLPVYVGHKLQFERPPMYWEFHSKGGQQAVRIGNWKGVRIGMQKNPDVAIELYDLASDPKESKDVAKEHPEVVKQMQEHMENDRTKSEMSGWNFELRKQ